jgi:hypothetical protein
MRDQHRMTVLLVTNDEAMSQTPIVSSGSATAA